MGRSEWLQDNEMKGLAKDLKPVAGYQPWVTGYGLNRKLATKTKKKFRASGCVTVWGSCVRTWAYCDEEVHITPTLDIGSRTHCSTHSLTIHRE